MRRRRPVRRDRAQLRSTRPQRPRRRPPAETDERSRRCWMSNARCLKFVLTAVVLCLLSAVSWAQGYTVTTASGQYHTPPSTKTALNLSSHSTTNITLPFDFLYFGNTYT